MNQSSTPTITNLDDVIDFEIMNYDQNKEFIKVILGIKIYFESAKKGGKTVIFYGRKLFDFLFVYKISLKLFLLSIDCS